MTRTVEVYIFRHGETDWNAEGRFQGHVDIPLNENGRAQARTLAAALHDKGIEAILSSDLKRARETAEIIAERLKIPVHTDAGIREAHLGKAQGLTLAEIKAKVGHEVTMRWRSSHPTDADISYPGGETGTHVMERTFRALEKFLSERDYGRVGVSTHGGVIRRVMQKIAGKPVPIPNTVLYRLVYKGPSLWEVDLK